MTMNTEQGAPDSARTPTSSEAFPRQRRASNTEALTLESTREQFAAKSLVSLEEEYKFLRKLYKASNSLNRSLDYATVLDNMLVQLEQFVDYDATCLMLVENDKARIFRWQGYLWNESQASISSVSFSIKEVPDLREVSQTLQPLISTIAGDDAHWVHRLGDTQIKSHLTVPIVVRSQLIGFLHVDSHGAEAYNYADAEGVRQFINQAGIALHNASVYDQVRRESAQRVANLKKGSHFASAVLNTAGALVMVLTAEGKILRFNRACEQATGYAFEEVRGKLFWDTFLPPSEVERIQTKFSELQADRSGNEYESLWLGKDKRPRVIAWSNTVLCDIQGKVEYVISTGTDITARRQLEDRLSAIHQLGRELNLIRDETAICKIALDTVSFLLHIKSSGYGLLDPVTDTLDYYYYPKRGVPQFIELKLPLEAQQRLDVLQKKRRWSPELLEDTQPSLSVLQNNAYPLWLTAPMKVQERVIGAFDVESQPPHHFTRHDQRLLQTLADQAAVALENARLYRETQQRIDELTTLTMISQAITSTLDLDVTLTIITDHTVRLLNAEAASVALLDITRSEIRFQAASGRGSDLIRGRRLPAGEGIVGWVIQHGEAAMVEDVSQDKRFTQVLDRQTGFKTHSVICVPLQNGLQSTGAIEVLNRSNGVFSREDLRLLTWLATPAAIAIENARLYEAERRAREQAETLREATATLTSSLEPDQVLSEILVHLEQVVPYDHAYVFLQDETGGLRIVAQKSAAPAAATLGQEYPNDNPLYQKVKQSGNPVIIANAQNDPRFESWPQDEEVRGWMGIPLIAQDQVIGLLTLNSHQIDAFDRVHASLGQAFANKAAVAIQNARLFQQVRLGHRQLQSLSHRLVEVQEAERRSIARELHDEAGQALTSLMVGLRLLEGEKDQPGAVASRAAALRQITNDISENLHRLAINLRPASLDYVGLVAALRQYIENFGRQYAIETHFEAVGFDEQRLPPDIETSLYRIVQEALTNVAKHAQADRIDIFLEKRNNFVITIVEDNGLGFDPEEAERRGRLGLLGIRERTEMLNGALVVESTAGIGTTIHVEVPYDSNTNC
jgi:PAS domain S-box-containing protein